MNKKMQLIINGITYKERKSWPIEVVDGEGQRLFDIRDAAHAADCIWNKSVFTTVILDQCFVVCYRSKLRKFLRGLFYAFLD